jgi:hypothetical protein
MKRRPFIFIFLFILIILLPSHLVAQEPENKPVDGGYLPYGQERDSGFYLGGESGALIFLGNSSNVFSPAFISSIKFGYSLKRRLNFQLRLLEGNGDLNFNGSGTFFFITEFDTKINFTKTAFSPFILGGIGFYVLDFGGFDPFVFQETNLTYVGGGGFDYRFGSNSVGLGVDYRGFVNEGFDFQGLEILVQYTFSFF